MQVQIVRASTRHRALAEARRIIGPDPLVLSVRRRPGGRVGEEWEAIVARDTPEPILSDLERMEAAPGEELAQQQVPEPWEEVDRFRSELADFRASLGKGGRPPSTDVLTLAHRLSELEGRLMASALRGQEISERWAPLVQRLEAAGYPKTEALKVIQRVDDSAHHEDQPDWKAYSARVRDALSDGVRVAPIEERLEPGLVVFMGGAGVGKTTLAAKLAADLCLGGSGHPVLGVLKPRQGVGLETVRRCAGALGIEFVEIRDKAQLATLSERAIDHPVILDTPSVNPRDEVGIKELQELLSETPSAEVHTVVSTCYSHADVELAVGAHAWAPKRRLSATHLDESPLVGRVMAAAARTRVPIGYMSLGPRIPDDLARPAIDSLIDSVLSSEGAVVA